VSRESATAVDEQFFFHHRCRLTMEPPLNQTGAEPQAAEQQAAEERMTTCFNI